ncbi:hypothetical protein [Bifidobacterium callitrichos]|uniref:Uncharacterized protein n=1 Tax=Bifidobacterium callitrichos DSM 23973 TaxID=1437609 RepID=A0A086ZVP1_9BIFI|nr:hypothetical protein [Bifidobacterium callitrichos]KFI50591.1 hypothetical protein BCAL_1729 [Bifidobacterium callitrichos DSM 23973]
MNDNATTAGNPDGEAKWETLQAQAARIASLQVDIKRAQDEIDRLKAQILENWPVGSYEAGDLKVQVKAGSQRLDAKRFAQTYPAANNPKLYKVAPDVSAARRALGEDALADLMRRDKASVVVK